MTIFIDADGCPVVDITDKLSKQAGADLVIVCDASRGGEVTVSYGGGSVTGLRDFPERSILRMGYEAR